MSLTLSSRDAFGDVLTRARDVALCAYTLAPTGAVARALEAAADRGAHVAVRLESRPTFGRDAPAGDASGIARALAAHGVVVTTSAPGGSLEHLKAAVVDGVAYLDDRNWATRGHETILRDDDPADVAAVARAIADGPNAVPCAGSDASTRLALEKRAAFALEVDAIRMAPGDRIDVASESFGGSALSGALAERARAGDHVRLEVAARALATDPTGREHAVLAHLAAAGVEIRAVGSDEKFADLGDRVWVGSANATFTAGVMSDWGATTTNRAIEAELAATFASAWDAGRPVL